MDRKEAEERIRAHTEEYLETRRGVVLKGRSASGTSKPFRCINPAHDDRNPSMFYNYDVKRAFCMSCKAKYDIFDLIGEDYGLSTFPEQLEKGAELYGISIDAYHGKASAAEDFKPEGRKQDKSKPPEAVQPPEADYSAYFRECHSRITETDYPQRRGLGAAVVDRFMLGYDASWRNPLTVAQGKNPPATPRLIIPTSRSSYVARDAREDAPKEYRYQKVGQSHVFNLKALEDARPCFIVEGEIDALSIIEVGGNAVALGSTSNVDKLLQELEARKPGLSFIIATDNDDAGRKAGEKLAEGLQKLGLPFYRRDVCNGCKDQNEALLKDREAFTAAIEEAERYNPAEEEKRAYLQTSAAANLQSFIDGIAASVNTPCISSGFFGLDEMLDGGFYEGLYIMGAISSLGKTSLALQMCDLIARGGDDVLIFSLEMARAELMAKSISRQTLQIATRDHLDTKNAKTGRGITDGKRHIHYSAEERGLIRDAVNAYSEYAEHVFILEGVGDIGTGQIRAAIEKHIRLTGRKPFVLVDYLQILAPYSDRATDKQNTDKAVLELKRISRDFKIPLLAISSLNRMSYNDAVSMEAFKESGAIEYSADVLIGLQLKGAGSKTFNATEAKKKEPRKVEIVILKNRSGAVGGVITLDYYPRFNFFEEAR